MIIICCHVPCPVPRREIELKLVMKLSREDASNHNKARLSVSQSVLSSLGPLEKTRDKKLCTGLRRLFTPTRSPKASRAERG